MKMAKDVSVGFHFLDNIAGISIFNMKTMAFVLFIVFAVIILGFLLGKITIKGVNLGSAGVFIIALVAGHFLNLGFDSIWQVEDAATGEMVSGWESVSQYFGMVKNMGLVMFVTSVGLLAGPTFFHNLKKNFKSFVLLGLIIIASGAAVCVLITLFAPGMNSAMSVGLFAGALTSTPAFAAAQEVLEGSKYFEQVAVGNGIAYPFGVIGVVLFVQIIPKVYHLDMAKERQLLTAGMPERKQLDQSKLFKLDSLGIATFCMTVACGIILGSINIPLGGGQSFSLGTTGGPLIAGLIFGHFGHIGKLSLDVDEKALHTMQEMGLVLFLTGSGIEGGRLFVKTLSQYGPVLFLYGALITIVPLFIGFFIAKYAMKMSFLNTLGSITGGMTSTPALGTLTHVAGTSDVASAYASTYPIALICVVLAAQFLTKVPSLV